MSVLCEFAIFPTDRESVSEYVSRVIKMIRDSGVDYQLTPMGTIIEVDEVKEATEFINRAYELLSDCNRVYLVAKMDIRKGKSNRLKGKIRSIEEKIGKVNAN